MPIFGANHKVPKKRSWTRCVDTAVGEKNINAQQEAETVALSQNPQFLAIIERSRARQIREGGVSSADMRQRFTESDG